MLLDVLLWLLMKTLCYVVDQCVIFMLSEVDQKEDHAYNSHEKRPFTYSSLTRGGRSGAGKFYAGEG